MSAFQLHAWRYLAQHPHFDVTAACAAGRAGETLAAVHPQFAGTAWANLVLDETTVDMLGQADLVFLALPHGESAALAAKLPAVAMIVDLGADYRLTSADAWGAFYSGEHAGSWTYGLPQLPGARQRIAGSTKVANPGCYPTSVALALTPLAQAGAIAPTDIVVVAASGPSGAGRKASDGLLATNIMGSMSAYKVGGVHQHTPEMEQSIATAGGWDIRDVQLSFTPMLAPMPRGIVATCTARLTGNADVRRILAEAYAEEQFVTLLPEGQWPHTGSVNGTNSAQLQVAVDQHTGRVIVVSVIDNLGKGAAGQAIQNANLMLGLDEGAGLDVIGIAP
ncbi:MAG: N-acetyl-gamma-glutamyl-phosphate reductase [Candidatus Nanopelagicales bacterium]